jgi:hypothetical protein
LAAQIILSVLVQVELLLLVWVLLVGTVFFLLLPLMVVAVVVLMNKMVYPVALVVLAVVVILHQFKLAVLETLQAQVLHKEILAVMVPRHLLMQPQVVVAVEPTLLGEMPLAQLLAMVVLELHLLLLELR